MVVSSTSEKISLIQVWLDSSNKFCFSWSPASIIKSGVTVESAGEIKMIILSFIFRLSNTLVMFWLFFVSGKKRVTFSSNLTCQEKYPIKRTQTQSDK